MIISGCENVTWAEAGTVPALDLAVASYPGIGVHDDQWCERVDALAVLGPETRATPTKLRQCWRQRFAGYKVRDRIQFVAKPSMSGTGALVKAGLCAERQSR